MALHYFMDSERCFAVHALLGKWGAVKQCGLRVYLLFCVWLWAHVYRSDLVGLISVYFLSRFKCIKWCSRERDSANEHLTKWEERIHVHRICWCVCMCVSRVCFNFVAIFDCWVRESSCITSTTKLIPNLRKMRKKNSERRSKLRAREM